MKSKTERTPSRNNSTRNGLLAAAGGTALAVSLLLSPGTSEAQKKETIFLDSLEAGNGELENSVLLLRPGTKIHAQPDFNLGGEDSTSQNVEKVLESEAKVTKPLVRTGEDGNLWYGFTMKKSSDDESIESRDQSVVWVAGKVVNQSSAGGEAYGVHTAYSQETDPTSLVASYDPASGQIVDYLGDTVATLDPLKNK